MHRIAVVVAFLLTVGAASSLFAQNATRDPQAIALINSCLQASGGSGAVTSIQDFVASGTITFNWDTSTQGNVNAKARVTSNQFRLDATGSNGTRSWSASNGNGVLVDLDQTRTTFTYQTALGLRNLSWPIADFVPALNDPNSAISYIGLVSSDQGQAYQIHIQEAYASENDPTGALSAASARDYFIDPATYLLVEIKNTQSSGGGQNYTEAVLFSSHTNVNGVMVPFSISEQIAGQQTWTVQFNAINFNVGLSDADFQL